MGSFSYTCALTNLPIELGDDVRFILLTENPYDEGLCCSIHDTWFPRTWPIRAKYNSYGSIEKYDEKSPSVYALTEGFKKDLIEVGTGNNSIHDVPAKKGMSFEDTLEALWEHRIRVIHDAAEPERSKKHREHVQPKIPEHIPCLNKIETILKENQFKLENTNKGLLVDEKGYGWVRIRVGGFSGESKLLESVLPYVSKDFVAVVTAGSDASSSPEIQVMPKPNSEQRAYFIADKGEKPGLLVSQAMILSRAWDELLKLVDKKRGETVTKEVTNWWNSINEQLDSAENIKKLSKIEGLPEKQKKLLFGLSEDYHRSDWVFFKDPIPFSVALGVHFRIIAKRHKTEPFSQKQIDEFLQDAVDFMLIHGLVYESRQYWKPGYSVGPQFGNYKFQAKWHQKLGALVKQIDSEQPQY